MFTVQMDSVFSGKHMGLTFTDGKAQTNDAFLATRLKSRGYKVTAEKGADDTEVPKQVEESKGKKESGKKKKSAGKPAPEAEPALEPDSNEPQNLPPLDDEQGDE